MLTQPVKKDYLKQPLLKPVEDFFKELVQKHEDVTYPEIVAKNHPHILNELAFLWPYPKKVNDYFHQVLFSEAGQKGFAVGAFEELMKLQCTYDKLVVVEKDIWEEHKYKR
jgi:hypothetical protein